jgi:methionyl-tRNA formyltransferase
MRAAILTDDLRNEFALRVVERLAAQGDEVATVVVTRRRVADRAGALVGRHGARGAAARALAAVRRAAPKPSPGDVAPAAALTMPEPFVVPALNDPAAIGHLRAVAPDVLVYTGGGILRDELIGTPRLGVLNAHMAHLPDYKGMNVLEWAIYHGDSPAVTVHFIDRGIDTGAVLFEREVAVRPGDTLASVRERAAQASVDGIADAVRGLATGTIEPVAQPQGGKQYFVMHERLRALAERRLADLSRPAP